MGDEFQTAIAQAKCEALLSPEPSTEGIDWTNYARRFDLLSDLLPAYRQNIEALKAHIRDRRLRGSVRIADIGAGTGNFSIAAAELLPEAEISHVDFNSSMNQVARAKYESAQLSNITIIEDHVQRIEFEQNSLDLAICVNVLYAVPPQEILARKIRDWLKPDGTLFIIDFGRKQNAFDWGMHLFRNMLSGRNTRKHLEFLFTGRDAISQAFRGRRSQSNGSYWMHSTEEFRQFLVDAKFQVDTIYPCYRGYADLAICRPAPLEEPS
jgi:ubiquinone/menaquinone biosynthesis C-methylase UbiE